MTINTSSFTGNSSATGGAIYGTGVSTTNITGTNFTSNSANSGRGGAIYSDGAISVSGGTFTSNTANISGGAIYNNLSLNLSNNVNFTGNGAVNGGAIYNSGDSTIGAVGGGGTFMNNTASASGGAIYNNTGTTTITGAAFNTNSATTSGGAIYNTSGGTFTINNSIFSGNSSAKGGALYDTAGGTTNVTSSNFTANTATVSGGAIYANGATNITGGTFTGNIAATSGGGIYNDGTTTLSGVNFTNNSVTNGSGGAIYNNSGKNLDITNGNFYNNSATNNGGAIYNGGTLYVKSNAVTSLFSGNTARGASNAIYNAGTTYLYAGGAGGNITFNDAVTSNANTNAININSPIGSPTLTNGIVNFNNSVTNSTVNVFNGTVNFGENIFLANDKLNISGGTSNFINQNLNTSNPIILSGGVMNLNSGNGGSTYINDTISGAGTININSPVGSNPTGGTTYINNSITGGTMINLYNGMMVINNESYINNNVLRILDGIINTQNNHIGTMALVDAAFTGVSNWLLDVDLANKIGDAITTTGTTSGILNISSINLLSDANSLLTAIIVADANTKNHLSTSVSSINSALFKYAVSYDGAAGALNFVKTGISPDAVPSDVSQTSTFLLQTAIDRQFFGNVDAFMSFPLSARESTICCALAHDPTSGYTGGACPISGNGTFSPIYSCDLNKGIWVKDFVSFENIPLNNGPNVSTVEYGTLVGADAPLRYLGHGIVGNTSVYAGYLGSNQNYDGVGVSQNGALVGIAENMVYKNTFLTLMASVGSSLGTSISKWGNDYFSSLFTGVAAKGGYNFEFMDGEYILQPNLMVAYTFTNTPNYTTASGLNMSSKPLNAMQIAPGVRLIKNRRQERGQVYLVANMVYNLMDKTDFTANDVQLPQLSIDPYFEYGIGFQRVWKERFTGFAQTLLRGGGRNGVALQFGLRWAI